jgi:hypothetical protein
METVLDIRLDSLESPQVLALIREHLAAMESIAPPESRQKKHL